MNTNVLVPPDSASDGHHNLIVREIDLWLRVPATLEYTFKKLTMNTWGLERLKLIPLSTSSDSGLWHLTIWSSMPVSSMGTFEHFLPENVRASISSSVDSPSEATSCKKKMHNVSFWNDDVEETHSPDCKLLSKLQNLTRQQLPHKMRRNSKRWEAEASLNLWLSYVL